MSTKRKTTVAVIFGGRSVEHDVSIVTGHQIMEAFDPERYDVVPVYITRDGRWFTGDPLRTLKNFEDEVISFKGVMEAVLSPSVQHHGLIVNPIAGRLQKSEVQRVDVVFPAIHGSHGEDGTLQGLFELADIPYVGCGVLASAVANDKDIAKRLLAAADIATAPGQVIERDDWLANRDAVLGQLTQTAALPAFVKPVTLGSSIGVARVTNADAMALALDIALRFDRRVLVEVAIEDGVEINCAVMGNGTEIKTSVLEQPISWEEFLTYEEKYMRGGGGMKSAERLIPAPLDAALTQRIQEMARAAFRAVDGRGTARVDFLLREADDTLLVNEINTMPGSLAFYLWRETGMSAAEVVDTLVHLARDANAEKRRSTYDYQTSLVGLTASRGLKGTKGTKTASG